MPLTASVVLSIQIIYTPILFAAEEDKLAPGSEVNGPSAEIMGEFGSRYAAAADGTRNPRRYYYDDKYLVMTELYLESLGVKFPLENVQDIGGGYYTSEIPDSEQLRDLVLRYVTNNSLLITSITNCKLLSFKMDGKLYSIGMLLTAPENRQVVVPILMGEHNSDNVRKLNTQLEKFCKKL